MGWADCCHDDWVNREGAQLSSIPHYWALQPVNSSIAQLDECSRWVHDWHYILLAFQVTGLALRDGRSVGMILSRSEGIRIGRTSPR